MSRPSRPSGQDISSPGGKVITFTTTPILSDKFDVLWGSCLAGLLQIIAWIKKISPIIERVYELDDAIIAFQQLANSDLSTEAQLEFLKYLT
ncbi:uncharacterized protein TNCV_1970491 [Trichonephila clavipes]|uniref:Uncharacterized protein n=1 Tax=Trichonephila clavipes TaxID=2585209 RepID=A0A8X6W5L8_TRICX|nr:uncharacterized protein TNCV_1970491 [Trichonephila clavipes]